MADPQKLTHKTVLSNLPFISSFLLLIASSNGKWGLKTQFKIALSRELNSVEDIVTVNNVFVLFTGDLFCCTYRSRETSFR